jgi:MFS transporter, SP family, sugar:H+ symporter
VRLLGVIRVVVGSADVGDSRRDIPRGDPVGGAGQGISVAVNLGATFVLTQTFLSMLCALKYATFIYYAAWVVVMTAFVVAFLPETKGVPLEAMGDVWVRHWYWGRFVQQQNKNADP